MSDAFLTAEWRHLAMLNYAVDPRVLEPHRPAGTEIDDHEGVTYVSLVAFRFLDTRVRGVPIPFHRDFEEINLRFYVRSRGPEGRRRGVVFVREVVPRRAIASVARLLYNENYVARPTRSTVVDPGPRAAGRVEYGWRHGGRWLSIGASFDGAPELPRPGSREEFITEHYWGYSAQRDGGTVEYRVEHPQWRVWPAREAALGAGTAEFYGGEFSAALSLPPRSAFVADGSAVTVHRGRRIDARASA